MSAPIVLVPGFWLGAWAWDEVVAALRDDGHKVTALTLPGLDSFETDRSGITLEDHVDYIGEAVQVAGNPVVLAVHSGAGAPGYAVSDRMPERIARMIYVDTGPATGLLDPDMVDAEFPLPEWDDLDENLDGISEDQLETFRQRAVPQPGGPMREAAELTDDARLDVPTTIICCAFSSEEYKQAAEAGYAFLGGLTELRDVTWVDLPTSHWPMWSRPKELADLIGDIATDARR